MGATSWDSWQLRNLFPRVLEGDHEPRFTVPQPAQGPRPRPRGSTRPPCSVFERPGPVVLFERGAVRICDTAPVARLFMDLPVGPATRAGYLDWDSRTARSA